MEVYLDNCATTRISDVALRKIVQMSVEIYANPSSSHKLGLLAERELTLARENIAEILNAKSDEIYFTSGATEANNLAILGVASGYKRDGNHIITQKSEHPSVIESCKHLEQNGYKITYLNNNIDGSISDEELENQITDDTILVSLMHVNNETGVIFDIEKYSKIIKSKNKEILFHVDAVQSFCKFDIDVKKLNIDLLTFSGHKVHSPKGAGGLYVKKGTKIHSRQFGGSQEKKLRPGTENIIGITALNKSILYLHPLRHEHFEKAENLKKCLLEITNELDGVFVNGENTSPYCVNLSFIGVKGEVLVHALEEKDIFISTGSACHKGANSLILTNYGLDKERVQSGVRISFSYFNTIEEIEFLKESLKEIVPILRKFTKR